MTGPATDDPVVLVERRWHEFSAAASAAVLA
jgi:hypothetical protein